MIKFVYWYFFVPSLFESDDEIEADAYRNCKPHSYRGFSHLFSYSTSSHHQIWFVQHRILSATGYTSPCNHNNNKITLKLALFTNKSHAISIKFHYIVWHFFFVFSFEFFFLVPFHRTYTGQITSKVRVSESFDRMCIKIKFIKIDLAAGPTLNFP